MNLTIPFVFIMCVAFFVMIVRIVDNYQACGFLRYRYLTPRTTAAFASAICLVIFVGGSVYTSMIPGSFPGAEIAGTDPHGIDIEIRGGHGRIGILDGNDKPEVVDKTRPRISVSKMGADSAVRLLEPADPDVPAEIRTFIRDSNAYWTVNTDDADYELTLSEDAKTVSVYISDQDKEATFDITLLPSFRISDRKTPSNEQH